MLYLMVSVDGGTIYFTSLLQNPAGDSIKEASTGTLLTLLNILQESSINLWFLTVAIARMLYRTYTFAKTAVNAQILVDGRIHEALFVRR